MPRRKAPPAGQEQMIEMLWPVNGLNRSMGFEHQPRLTAREAQNVRSYNARDQRQRGGPREGLVKLFSSKVSGAHRIQLLSSVVGTPTPTTGDIDPRFIQGLAVADGDVVTWEVGVDLTFATPTGGTNALSTTAPVIFAAEHSGKLFFADGATAAYYTADTDTVSAWTASTAGTLPAGGGGIKPRLITTWRGRIVLAGLRDDGQNWFMSAVGDPFDWDYAPATTIETQAVAGNNSDAGKVGDIITGLIPAGDDKLIFLGDHTIWQMTGDPMAGGRIDLVSDTVGGAWGQAWAKDDDSNIYFLGMQGGVFMLPRGQMQLQRISTAVDDLMTNVPGMVCRMLWDTKQRGLYVFRTSPDGLATINFFYDSRNKAWWPDVYADPAFNPLAVHVLDGDDPDDRHLLFGGEDGYIRYPDATAVRDDGEDIEAHVMLGPVLDGKDGSLMLKELIATLGMDELGYAGPVRWFLYTGNSAEEAVYQTVDSVVPPPAGTQQFEYRTFDASGSWNAGRNRVDTIRRSGTVFYVWLFSTAGKTFRFERVEAVLRGLGAKRYRKLV